MNRIISKPINLWQNGWVDRNKNGAGGSGRKRGVGWTEWAACVQKYGLGRKGANISRSLLTLHSDPSGCEGSECKGYIWLTETCQYCWRSVWMGKCHIVVDIATGRTAKKVITKKEWWTLRNGEDIGPFSLTFSVLARLTDYRRGLQLTPLILYAGSHSLSTPIYLFLFLPYWLAHSCSRSIKLIKGSILSWSPLANTSANQ